MGEPGIAVHDRSVYLHGADALVLADLHLGRDATSGVAWDLGGIASATERFRRLLGDLEPAEVVLAGDVLHDFHRIPERARDALEALVDAAERVGSDFVLVEGNHDTRLESVRPTVPEHALRDGTLVCHGHEPPVTTAPRYVVGHDHPAIVIEGRRRPCVLVGEAVFRGGDVVALPAFSELCVGTAVNSLRGGDLSSPLLADLDAFRPFVHDPARGETLAFPPLGELRTHL